MLRISFREAEHRHAAEIQQLTADYDACASREAVLSGELALLRATTAPIVATVSVAAMTDVLHSSRVAATQSDAAAPPLTSSRATQCTDPLGSPALTFETGVQTSPDKLLVDALERLRDAESRNTELADEVAEGERVIVQLRDDLRAAMEQSWAAAARVRQVETASAASAAAASAAHAASIAELEAAADERLRQTIDPMEQQLRAAHDELNAAQAEVRAERTANQELRELVRHLQDRLDEAHDASSTAVVHRAAPPTQTDAGVSTELLETVEQLRIQLAEARRETRMARRQAKRLEAESQHERDVAVAAQAAVDRALGMIASASVADPAVHHSPSPQPRREPSLPPSQLLVSPATQRTPLMCSASSQTPPRSAQTVAIQATRFVESPDSSDDSPTPTPTSGSRIQSFAAELELRLQLAESERRAAHESRQRTVINGEVEKLQRQLAGERSARRRSVAELKADLNAVRSSESTARAEAAKLAAELSSSRRSADAAEAALRRVELRMFHLQDEADAAFRAAARHLHVALAAVQHVCLLEERERSVLIGAASDAAIAMHAMWRALVAPHPTQKPVLPQLVIERRCAASQVQQHTTAASSMTDPHVSCAAAIQVAPDHVSVGVTAAAVSVTAVAACQTVDAELQPLWNSGAASHGHIGVRYEGGVEIVSAAPTLSLWKHVPTPNCSTINAADTIVGEVGDDDDDADDGAGDPWDESRIALRESAKCDAATSVEWSDGVPSADTSCVRLWNPYDAEARDDAVTLQSEIDCTVAHLVSVRVASLRSSALRLVEKQRTDMSRDLANATRQVFNWVESALALFCGATRDSTHLFTTSSANALLTQRRQSLPRADAGCTPFEDYGASSSLMTKQCASKLCAVGMSLYARSLKQRVDDELRQARGLTETCVDSLRSVTRNDRRSRSAASSMNDCPHAAVVRQLR